MIMHTPYASRAVGLLAALVLGGMVLLAGCGGREEPSAPLSSGEASGSAESSAPESTVPDASGEDASDASSASSSAQTDDTRPTGGASSKPGGSTAGGGASTASTRPNNSSSGAASSSAPVTTTTTSRTTTAPDGATMAFRILDNMDCPPEEIATIVTAIGNHDEGTGMPVNAVAAALILADKSDVRRSRVRNPDMASFDIHDRVNYSVKKSVLKINEEHTLIKLKLSVDTHVSSVMDYFEIFLQRMILCRKAADKLGLQFRLLINEQQLM